MRRNWQSNRLFFLIATLLFSGILITMSATGILAPIENLASIPLQGLASIFNRAIYSLSNSPLGFEDYQSLQQRNGELEVQLAELQGELSSLREIASDYNRLTNLLEYIDSTERQEFVTADVIGEGVYGLVRSIIINRGTRDGITVGMPVVTDLGLVGRIFRVTANLSQVQLVTDQNSFVSGRLETSRSEGTVVGKGLESGSLEMRFIPLEAEVLPGNLVVTSGLGGNFPPNLVIGQVISVRNLEFELTQEAQLSSLIDFNELEFVLVITSFQPADLSTFENPAGQ